ncbi:MAG: SpoIIE family protein phosphatase [Planctomycetota bacterium]|nr:SpoIIE family protein phosphatase [Planctomycetota bacterium]
MLALTDYIRPQTLSGLQDAFAEVARGPVVICAADGTPVIAASVRPDKQFSSPIVVDGNTVGHVALGEGTAADEAEPWRRQFLQLSARVIALLVSRETRLKDRVEELATVYALTSEFTTERDVQKVLDVTARTVVKVMDAKACVIRLLSEDRTELLMEAVTGLSEEYVNKGQVLVADSHIDREVLEKSRAVHVADLGSDPRVMYPEEARREGIVSALCAPMIYKGGPVGVIRVYTAVKREFDWYEVSLLTAIAAQAAGAVINARLYAEAVRAGTMQRALQMAGEVQRRMVPQSAPTIEGFDIGAVYVSCFEVGGDFYDFLPLGTGNLGVAVCDVVGKGVRASLLMASIRASLRAHAASIYELSEVIRRVNADLCADTDANDFASLFYGVLDSRARRFTYANAGHIPPLLLRNGQVTYLGAGGGLIGIDPAARWRHESIAVRSGDVIFAFTDGLHEALNFRDEPFGRRRVEAAALAAIADGCSATRIVNHALWEMRRFAGLQTRFDDTTIVAVKAL